MNITEQVKSKILSMCDNVKTRRIGVEIESFYYDSNELLRLPVNGINRYSASNLLDDITLETKNNKEKYSYSLEPGGQLEWASSPQISLWDISDEYSKHLKYQERLCVKNNINIGYFSVEPISSPQDIKLIDLKKYHLMNDMFKKTGSLGQWMMRNTTSLQLNVDYLNERDANEMAFIADAIQPLASILFSNAPFKEGRSVGNKNLRWEIWNNTDASRCRTLWDHEITNPNHLIDKYVKWLLSRKAIFLENPESTFNAFDNSLEKMIMSDTNDRLIYSAFRQIFTHVRFKTVLEIRACDRQNKGDEIIPAAFLTGLLTANKTRGYLLDEILTWKDEDRICLSENALSVDFSNNGPKNKSIGYWLEFLCQLCLDGLDERSNTLDIKNERALIESKLKSLISKGTKTKQIQDEFKNSGQTLKSFIKENYLDLYND